MTGCIWLDALDCFSISLLAFVISSCILARKAAKIKREMYNCSLLSRQLEEVDKALEVHRETERELHEKVVNANSSFIHYNVNCL